MKYIKKVLGEDLRQYTMVVALVALIIVFNIASGGEDGYVLELSKLNIGKCLCAGSGFRNAHGYCNRAD